MDYDVCDREMRQNIYGEIFTVEIDGTTTIDKMVWYGKQIMGGCDGIETNFLNGFERHGTAVRSDGGRCMCSGNWMG